VIEYRGAFYVATDEGAPHWKVLKVDPKKNRAQRVGGARP